MPQQLGGLETRIKMVKKKGQQTRVRYLKEPQGSATAGGGGGRAEGVVGQMIPLRVYWKPPPLLLL